MTTIVGGGSWSGSSASSSREIVFTGQVAWIAIVSLSTVLSGKIIKHGPALLESVSRIQTGTPTRKRQWGNGEGEDLSENGRPVIAGPS